MLPFLGKGGSLSVAFIGWIRARIWFTIREHVTGYPGAVRSDLRYTLRIHFVKPRTLLATRALLYPREYIRHSGLGQQSSPGVVGSLKNITRVKSEPIPFGFAVGTTERRLPVSSM